MVCQVKHKLAKETFRLNETLEETSPSSLPQSSHDTKRILLIATRTPWKTDHGTLPLAEFYCTENKIQAPHCDWQALHDLVPGWPVSADAILTLVYYTPAIMMSIQFLAHRKPFPPKALALNFPCQVSSISTSVPQNSFQVFWSFRFQLRCYDSERPSKTILTEISILLYSPPLSLVCFLHRTFNNLIVLSGYLEFISPARKWAWRKQRPRLTV